MAIRPQQGTHTTNTLRATMKWLEDPGFPPCLTTAVGDATHLYIAYRALDVLCLDVFFLSEIRAVSWPRFPAAGAHMPPDMAEVALHPAFHDFKQPFIKFCAHFGYTRPYPFPIDGDAVGDPAPLDAVARAAILVPPPPPAVPRPAFAEDPTLAHPVVRAMDGDGASDSDVSSSNVSSLTSAGGDSDS